MSTTEGSVSIGPATVGQVAKVLGVSSADLLVQMRRDGHDVRSAYSSLAGEVLQNLLSGVEPRRTLDEARDLVKAAFENARLTGREDWQRMSVGVLKNRLLDASNRQFDESDFGAVNMVGFVRLMPDLLSLDASQRQPAAVLTDPQTIGLHLDSEAAPESATAARTERVRHDLWRAIIDYRSQRNYFWDSRLGIARTSNDEIVEPRLPTLTLEESQAWRVEFIAGLQGINPEDQGRVAEWAEREYGTAYLPPSLRGPWNGFVRERVVERLHSFFETNGLAVPGDLVGEVVRDVREPSAPDRDTLRDLIHACVDLMTRSELEALKLDVGLVVRVLQQKSGS